MPRQNKTDRKFERIQEQFRRVAQNSEPTEANSMSKLEELTHALDEYSAIKLYADWAGDRVGKLVSELLSQGLMLLLKDEKPQAIQKMESVSNIGKNQKLLRASQVAEYLGVSKTQVYRMMQRGEIPTIRMGRSVRVRIQDLEEVVSR